MINPDDIKAGMVLGHADAQILRDAVLGLNNLEMELLALRKSREGWQLVPVEPTDEMLRAWRGDMHKSYARNHIEHIGDDEIAFAYRATLAAAPEPE